MQSLSKYDVQAIAVDTVPQWRTLERARYQYHFIAPDPQPVLDALDEYQNKDGGFGHGIEPDFWLPDSSPMATSVGLQYLWELEPSPEVQKRVDKALKYLRKSYDPEYRGWRPTSFSVNTYAHAPWWHHHGTEGNWGNPTVELVGYFLKWQPETAETSFKDTLDWAERYLMSMDPEDYEAHEIYCYLRLYQNLNEKRRARLHPTLQQAIKKLAICQPEEWDNYVPRPLDFVMHPNYEHFNLAQECITANLNYNALKLLNHRAIEPQWTWEPWPGLDAKHYWPNWEHDWGIARGHWIGILTVKALLQLKEFGWIK